MLPAHHCPIPVPPYRVSGRLCLDSASRHCSIEVLFHVDVPEALADTGVSLVQTLSDSGVTIDISTSFTTFTADTTTMEAPSVAPAMVDCVGSWMPDGECSEPCGPDGVSSSIYTITRAAQNGGEPCAAAGGETATTSCNTNVQCPVDCTGDWTEWSDCPVPCGGGTSIRSWFVATEPQHGGDCPLQDSVETQDCNTDACPPPPTEPTDCVGGARTDFNRLRFVLLCLPGSSSAATRAASAAGRLTVARVRMCRLERLQRVQPPLRPSWGTYAPI